mgnify:CR=1 FL=1
MEVSWSARKKSRNETSNVKYSGKKWKDISWKVAYRVERSANRSNKSTANNLECKGITVIEDTTKFRLTLRLFHHRTLAGQNAPIKKTATSTMGNANGLMPRVKSRVCQVRDKCFRIGTGMEQYCCLPKLPEHSRKTPETTQWTAKKQSKSVTYQWVFRCTR